MGADTRQHVESRQADEEGLGRTIVLDSESRQERAALRKGLPTGLLLAGVGGFLDAYTFVGYGGVFANAQTGNIVLFG